MKIIGKDYAYVQKKDILYLMNEKLKYNIRMDNYTYNIIASSAKLNDNYTKDIFIRYCDKEMIAFFKSIDYILDYNYLNSLSNSEINNYYKSIVDKIKSNTKDTINNNKYRYILSEIDSFLKLRTKDTICFSDDNKIVKRKNLLKNRFKMN